MRLSVYTSLRAMLAAFVTLMASNNVMASDVLVPWASNLIQMLDKPMMDSLKLYRTDGFILIDVANNYAAYAGSAKRLSDSQRKNIGSVEASSDFVVAFYGCKSDSSYFSGKISQVVVSYRSSDAADLAEEIQRAVDFSNRSLPDIKPSAFGPSSQKDGQAFMLWETPGKLFVEIQIEKFPHQLIWKAYKDCK